MSIQDELALFGDFLSCRNVDIIDDEFEGCYADDLTFEEHRQDDDSESSTSSRPAVVVHPENSLREERDDSRRIAMEHTDAVTDARTGVRKGRVESRRVVARNTVLSYVGDGESDSEPAQQKNNKRVTILVVRRDRRNNSMGIGYEDKTVEL